MKKYFITGATGLIGRALVDHLLQEGDNSVIAYVRNEKKARDVLPNHSDLVILEGELEDVSSYDDHIDYIIHAAAPTDSGYFVSHPVETIDSIISGTRSVLELAKSKKVESVINLSSMEVYGTPTNEEILTEDRQFYLDPMSIRSSYPMAKRLTETLCVAYAAEYNVPVRTARLAQVLGKELLAGDNRVVVQFIRTAKEGKDIELATDGRSKQTFVGIDDAITGILTVLRNGESGEAYNVANDETYSSIIEIAEIIADKLFNGKIKVIKNTSPNTTKYSPYRTLNMRSDKLRSLGWKPKTSLIQALDILAKS